MNPLTFLPLLACAAFAAPAGHHVLLASQPAITYAAQPAAVTYAAQPAAITYSAPATIQQTVHYENRPVVTGYQTTVVKPAIASAPLAVAGIPSNIALTAQLPEFTPPPVDSTTPPPLGDAPTLPPLTPPTQAPPSENGTSGDQGGQQPPIPIPGIPGGANLLQIINPHQFQFSSLAVPQTVAVQQVAAPAQVVAQAPAPAAQPVADAVVVEARAAPAAVQVAAPAAVQVATPVQVAAPAVQVATVRAAQAGDFEPLVTKEKVLAPVRTHTEITPQLTQIQPEITVRKVVHDVPVATPVAVQTPVLRQVAFQTPVIQQLQQVQQVQQVSTLPAAQIISA